MGGNNSVYRPLETARTIRLLDLSPGQPDDPIKFCLRHASLDDDPYYDALSYAWGDPTDTREVSINGFPANVTVSLFTALRQFRYPDPGQTRTLWADAVCINQQDIAEKTVQVQLMAQIYKKAALVLVWLGPSLDGVDAFINALGPASELVSKAMALYESSETGLSLYTSENFGDEINARRLEAQRNMVHFNWRPILDMLLRPWFSRKWVVQEVVLARHVIMQAGNVWFHLSQLGEIVRGLKDMPVAVTLMPIWGKELMAVFVNAYYLYTTHEDRMFGGVENHFDLLDLVMQTRTFQCTDARDHLFGLLGLADPELTSNPALMPDYTFDAKQIYWRFAIWELVDRQRPNIFSVPHHRSDDLPSWVPDLTRLDITNPLGVATAVQFSAGGTGPPDLRVSHDDNKILTCRGKRVDTLSKLLDRIGDRPMADEPPNTEFPTTLHARQLTYRQIQWLKDCEKLAGEGYTDSQGNLTPERFEQFWRAMLCEIHMQGPGARVDSGMGKLFAEYLMQTHRLFSINGSEFYTQYSKIAYMVDPAMDHFTTHRRLCTTSGGRLGQVPAAAAEGDEVWVIPGARVPFVVRLTPSGSRILIGECYLGGIMDGEAVRDDTGFVDLALE